MGVNENKSHLKQRTCGDHVLFWCLDVRGHKVNADLVNSCLEARSVSRNKSALAAPGHHSRNNEYQSHLNRHPLARVGKQIRFFLTFLTRRYKIIQVELSNVIIRRRRHLRCWHVPKTSEFPLALVLLSYQGTRTRSLQSTMQQGTDDKISQEGPRLNALVPWV